MMRTVFSLVLLVASPGLLAAAVNLSATLDEYVNEGFKFQKLTFKDDKRQVTMQLPNGWSYRGSAARLQLIPPGNTFVDAVIEAVPTEAPVSTDPAMMQFLTRQALASVPPGSVDAKVLGTEENAVILGGNSGFEVLVSYSALGQTFQRSTVFLNAPGTQLIFRFTAPKADYDRLHSAFRRAVLSWQWIDP